MLVPDPVDMDPEVQEQEKLVLVVLEEKRPVANHAVHLDRPERQADQEGMGRMDGLVRPECLEQRAERQAFVRQPLRLVNHVRKDHLDHLGRQDRPGNKELKDLRVDLDQREHPESKDQRVHLDSRAKRDCKDSREKLDNQRSVNNLYPERLEHPENKGRRVQEVRLDLAEHLESLERKDQKVRLGQRDRPDRRASPVRPDHRARLDNQERREFARSIVPSMVACSLRTGRDVKQQHIVAEEAK